MSTVELQSFRNAQPPADLPKQCEFVDGKVREKSVSGESSSIALQLAHVIMTVVRPANLGSVFGSDCGFQCFADSSDPQRIRKPDFAFIKSGRLTTEQFKAGFISIAPDIAAEVVSPNDNARELNEKVEDYLRAGVQLVWVIHPSTQTVSIYRQDGSAERLGSSGVLKGETVIPDFECSVKNLFPQVQ